MGACGMNRVWAEGQRRVMDLFQGTSIASVRQRGRVSDAPETEYSSGGGV
jgi:hypothetical protein